jgi:hypothetical protein
MRGRLAAIALVSLFALGGASGARAEWFPGHPRINEINGRLAMQRYRIAEGVRLGQIGPFQAWRDRAIDRRVGWQLRRDEWMHGGHITLAEQRGLNRELNWDSRRIYNERHW